MRVQVDRGLCQSHGQCEFAAPTVFTINDDGDLEYDEHPDEALRDAVESAADVCPMQAILVDD